MLYTPTRPLIWRGNDPFERRATIRCVVTFWYQPKRKTMSLMDPMEEGELTDMEDGECVPYLYDSKWADNVDRTGTRWGPPHRDHILFLMRMIPRMCLPFNHSLYEFTHKNAYELLCSSTTVYDPVILTQSPLNEACYMMEGLKGNTVRDLFPEFPDAAEVRPFAMYAVFCHTGSFHE